MPNEIDKEEFKELHGFFEDTDKDVALLRNNIINLEGETEIVLKSIRRKISYTLNNVVKYEGKNFSNELHKTIDNISKKLQQNLNIKAQKSIDQKIGVNNANISSNIMQSVTSAINNLIGGRRAIGGSVDTNKAYLVGKRGPEMFIPTNHGIITPRGLKPSMPNITMNITTPDIHSFRKSKSQLIAEFMDVFGGVMRR